MPIKENESKEIHNWKEIAFQFGMSAVREFSKKTIEGVHQKIERAVTVMIRRLLILFLLLIGVIFFMVGMAHLINDVLAGTSLGYIIVGVVSVVIAMFVNLMNKEVF